MRKAVMFSLLTCSLASGASAQSAPPAGSIIVPPQVPSQTQPSGPPMIQLRFDDAVARALDKNPTVALAATNITRAEALLQQTRSFVLPSIGASVSSVTLNTGTSFQGQTITPQTQVTFGALASMPVLAASQWAAVNQARDQITVSQKDLVESRRQIAIATGEAYLQVIAAKRQVDVENRALDNAKAHLDYADKRLAGGAGSRLNQLRAAQEASTEQTRLEAVLLILIRAQEALGVLVVEDGPVDAAEEPTFDVPPPSPETEWMNARPDIQLQQAVIAAAERVVADSWKDYLPTATVAFNPAFATPSGIFTPAGSWRLTAALTQNIYDGGERKAVKALRNVTLDQSKIQLTSLEIQARSDVRTARASLESAERALVSARQASDQANQVLTITTQAFEVGATTNLEVIDAQREARDTDTSRATAEDVVRRSRLDLLVALGRFPK
jgi:outer membrane protein TolC